MQRSTIEFLTSQFYEWEYRGRGWHLAEEPIQLEAGFIPFIRQLPQASVIDDGKRHTLVSRILESFKGPRPLPAANTGILDYSFVEVFPDDSSRLLCALQLRLPPERSVTPERMKALLLMASGGTGPISFEIIGNSEEVVVQFVCRIEDRHALTAQIGAYFPEVTIAEDDRYLELFEEAAPAVVVDFGLKDEFVRPLATVRNFNTDLLAGIYGILDGLTGIEQAGIQILFSGTINSWSEDIIRSVTASDGRSFFADAPESPKLAAEKTHSPLFAVTIRAFGQGESEQDGARILSRIAHILTTASRSSCNLLIPLPDRRYEFDTRIEDMYQRTSHRLGMLLNADELVNLLHFPPEHVRSAKLFPPATKTKPLPAIAKGGELVLGASEHEGRKEQATQSPPVRMKHTYVIGGTGTGKSTLLLSMIAQDMAHGHGLAVLDPHGDLFNDILPHIPAGRLKDVVIVDPSDSEYPVSLNILKAHSDIEKEALSSDLVAAFKRQSTSWGDQMHSVFSNAVLAFLESERGGTLADLRRFLVEPGFRNSFLQTVPDAHVQYYWQKEYPLLKTNSIGPILTRLDTFLRSKLIRNMIGQKRGLDFTNILDTQKILLVKLPQGLIGIENSYLLGSLFVSKIHQAALARQAITDRKQFYLYIDEFQHFITPSMASIITGVRKYQMGLVLAHQDMQQLVHDDGDLASAIIGSIGTRICFRVGETDAKRLAAGLSFFSEEDLQNLGTGEAIGRIERPENDFSFSTIPVQPSQTPSSHIQEIIDHSRSRYAMPKEIIEKELLEGLQNAVAPVADTEPAAERPQSPVKKPPPEPKIEPVIPVISAQDAQETIEKVAKQRGESQHRYLQMLIKKMAESRGYKAMIEAPTPDRKGKVDVLLEREGIQIACEVSVTTDAAWELHNIQKCLMAGYGRIMCCMNDPKGIAALQKKVRESLNEKDQRRIQVLQPEALFANLEATPAPSKSTETTFKGYRVKVSYDDLSGEEMKGKRESVARIVAESLKKIR